MNTTYARLELLRTTRDFVSMFFVAILPAFFFIIFGAAQDFGDERFGNGNVTMYIMVSMAAYGAVTATTGIGGMAAVERMQGWGRQLGLTPMGDGHYIAIKALVSVAIATVPVALIYALGYFTGADGTWQAWLLSAIVVVAGATLFALWGLAFGLAFRSEAAVSAASGSIVILAFLGNIFFPLSGTLLTFAKLTPLYGYAGLARYPITEGELANQGTGPTEHDALWVPLLNVGVWTLILAVIAVWLVRRSRGRQ
ncbi:ABC transporter permease [Aeromicrobium sp. CTD01-1L150]|uniref:ABC transporter permease n=1 Tax=Aeromicrobium sp. CTD01-1L150 TaxID=3341830 RepID=UPI0035BED9A6